MTAMIEIIPNVDGITVQGTLQSEEGFVFDAKMHVKRDGPLADRKRFVTWVMTSVERELCRLYNIVPLATTGLYADANPALTQFSVPSTHPKFERVVSDEASANRSGSTVNKSFSVTTERIIEPSKSAVTSVTITLAGMTDNVLNHKQILLFARDRLRLASDSLRPAAMASLQIAVTAARHFSIDVFTFVAANEAEPDAVALGFSLRRLDVLVDKAEIESQFFLPLPLG